jgi:hypothetical protein
MSQKIETAEIEEYSPGEEAKQSIAIPSGPITYRTLFRVI